MRHGVRSGAGRACTAAQAVPAGKCEADKPDESCMAGIPDAGDLLRAHRAGMYPASRHALVRFSKSFGKV